jgi:hypothetical protein
MKTTRPRYLVAAAMVVRLVTEKMGSAAEQWGLVEQGA